MEGGWRGGGGQSCHHSPVPVCESFVPKYCLIRLIKTNLPTLSVWLSRNKVLCNKNRALYERAYCDRVVFLFCCGYLCFNCFAYKTQFFACVQ